MSRRSRSRSRTPVEEPPPSTAAASVRADKWLWAARCFKTRSQATDACNNDQCTVNGRVVKPSYSIKVGDLVEVECPGGLRILFVQALADRRGPAAAAALLYEDRSPEPPPREPFAPEEHSGGIAPSKKPSKHQRRQLRKIRGY